MKSLDFKKLSRKAFLRDLAEMGASHRAMIEARVGGFSVSPEASAQRRERSSPDSPQAFRFFCETYFPHFIDASLDPSLFQVAAYELPLKIEATPGARAAVAAPRGEGKSTLLVQLHALWRLTQRLSRYMPIIMDAKEQAEMMLDAVKAELEVNPRLAQDYPECCGKGKTWKTGKIITANDVMLECFGKGKRIRGRRFGIYRPDFVFIDDFENDDTVRSKGQRDKDEGWLRKVVANLGPPDGSMRQMYVGTILHPDSVLVRTLKNPRWKGLSGTWPSVHTWPDRMDLWDRWEELFLNDSEEVADRFYAEHRSEMDAGAVVSWPGVRSLLVLMKLRAEDHHAFDTEHQHNPVDPEGHPFVGCVRFWIAIEDRWPRYGAHDPSMGKHSNRGDPSVSLVGAFDRDVGKLHIEDAIVARRVPDKQIADIIEMQRRLRCVRWGIESVAFQEFFRQELVKQSAKLHVPVPAVAVLSSTDKDLRIESLQPHMRNGLILFNRNHKTLISQFEQWPDADHDDGPDAVEMLWQVALRGGFTPGRVRIGKRRRSNFRGDE